MPYKCITIQFSWSASPQLPFALKEARKQSSFKQSNKTYSVSYSNNESDGLHRLLGYIKNIRSRRVFIDNIELPWDEAFHYIWCYQLRQKAYDPLEYCMGDARQYPAINIWGCIQTLMPLSNDTEWLHYGKFDTDGTWIFDKKKIAHYLQVNTHAFRFCPALSMNMVMNVLEAFPETANPKIDKDWVYSEALNRRLTISITASFGSEEPREYCGVRPASKQAIKNIYAKIVKKLTDASTL